MEKGGVGEVTEWSIVPAQDGPKWGKLPRFHRYCFKRRGRDSNPRWSFPHTAFPVLHNRPLCHLSDAVHLTCPPRGPSTGYASVITCRLSVSNPVDVIR